MLIDPCTININIRIQIHTYSIYFSLNSLISGISSSVNNLDPCHELDIETGHVPKHML